MNYYPFHIGDYLSATRHLSWEEDAAYRRLLDVYYTTEKPIPADHKQACRLVLATTETQREAVQTVLAEFFELTESGWINSRADAEIEAMREKQQKQRDKANAMWEKRKAAACTSTSPEHGTASAMPQHQEKDATASKTDANAMPPTPTPTPTPEDTSGKGGKPPADKAKAELWKAAVSLLEGQGMPEPQARAFFGKLSKDYPDGEIVLDAVRGAVTEQPADARAYLKATCQRLAGEKTRSGAPDWTRTAT